MQLLLLNIPHGYYLRADTILLASEKTSRVATKTRAASDQANTVAKLILATKFSNYIESHMQLLIKWSSIALASSAK